MTMRSPEPNELIAFHRALMAQDAAGLNRMIDANPALLCHIDYHGDLPLNSALRLDRPVSAKVILDALQKWQKEIRAHALPNNVTMDENNPLYLHGKAYQGRAWGRGYAHEAVATPEGIALLAEYGYDLNHGPRQHSLLSRLLIDYQELGNLPENSGSLEADADWLRVGSELLEKRDNMLAAAVRHGLKLNRLLPSGTLSHADLLINRMLEKLDRNTFDTTRHKMAFLASLGMDLRACADRAAMGMRAALHSNGWNLDLGKDLATEFSKEGRRAARIALRVIDRQERRTQTLTACGTGTLPMLLPLALRQSPEAYEEICSHLDDYWRGEYRHCIRRGDAVRTRGEPVEQGALAEWVRS